MKFSATRVVTVHYVESYSSVSPRRWGLQVSERIAYVKFCRDASGFALVSGLSYDWCTSCQPTNDVFDGEAAFEDGPIF